MFTLVAIQSAIMDGTSQMQQLFAGNKVFFQHDRPWRGETWYITSVTKGSWVSGRCELHNKKSVWVCSLLLQDEVGPDQTSFKHVFQDIIKPTWLICIFQIYKLRKHNWWFDCQSLSSQVGCRGDEESLLACPHTYTVAGKVDLRCFAFNNSLSWKLWAYDSFSLLVLGCDTDTVAGVHCLPTPLQEAASKVLHSSPVKTDWPGGCPQKCWIHWHIIWNEIDQQVSFMVLGMALALLFCVSGIGVFYLRFIEVSIFFSIAFSQT